MRLCELKDNIESLLNCTLSSIQDLPWFYEYSVLICKGDPRKHAKYSLLVGSGTVFMTKVKHSTITVLAEIILNNLAILKQDVVDQIGRVKLIQHFQLAHIIWFRFRFFYQPWPYHLTTSFLWGPIYIAKLSQNNLENCRKFLETSHFSISHILFHRRIWCEIWLCHQTLPASIIWPCYGQSKVSGGPPGPK